MIGLFTIKTFLAAKFTGATAHVGQSLGLLLTLGLRNRLVVSLQKKPGVGIRGFDVKARFRALSGPLAGQIHQLCYRLIIGRGLVGDGGAN